MATRSSSPECFFRPFAPAQLKVCGGIETWHHVIRRNRLRLERPHLCGVSGKRGIILDKRNQVLCCWFHHEKFEHKQIVVPPEAWPPSVHEFAAEYALEGWLSRYIEPLPAPRRALIEARYG